MTPLDLTIFYSISLPSVARMEGEMLSPGFMGFAVILITFGGIIWAIGRVGTLLFRPKPLWALSLVRFGLTLPIMGFIFIGWSYLVGWLVDILPMLAIVLLYTTYMMMFGSGMLAMLFWETLIPGFWRPWFRFLDPDNEEEG